MDNEPLILQNLDYLKANQAKISNPRMLPVLLFNVGNYYNRKKLFTRSTPLYLETSRICDSLDIHDLLVYAYMQLGFNFRQIEDIDKALEYMLKARPFIHSIKRQNTKASYYNNLAHWYLDKNNLDSCLHYLDEVFKIDPNKLSALGIRSNVYMELGKFELAEKDIIKQLELNADPMELDNIYGRYGGLEERRGNFPKALKYYQKAYNLGIGQVDFENRKNIVEGILSTYFSIYNPEYSMYVDTLNFLHDTLIQINNASSIIQSDIRFDTERQKRENINLQLSNELKQSQLRVQKHFLWGSTIALGLISLLVFSLLSQNKKRRQYNKKLMAKNEKIQLLHREALHRSKNQLVLATSLIGMQKNAAESVGAKELIQESELKLRALSAVNKRLSDDDAHEKLLLKDVCDEVVKGNIFSLSNRKIDYRTEISGIHIQPEKLSLVSLILNELSVNSIKHAFDNQPEPRIDIKAYRENGVIVLEYLDNGITSSTYSVGKGAVLLNGLSSQLKGQIIQNTTDGYHFTIKFPVDE